MGIRYFWWAWSSLCGASLYRNHIYSDFGFRDIVDGYVAAIYLIKQLYLLNYDVGIGYFSWAWAFICNASLYKKSDQPESWILRYCWWIRGSYISDKTTLSFKLWLWVLKIFGEHEHPYAMCLYTKSQIYPYREFWDMVNTSMAHWSWRECEA